MGIRPEGDAIKKAVKWVGEARKENPDRKVPELVDEACRRFDLSPVDAEFLMRMATAG